MKTQAHAKLEEGWQKVKAQVEKLHKFLEQKYSASDQAVAITKKDYSDAYTTIYNLCTQKENDHNSELFRRYSRVFETYLWENVSPALRNRIQVDFLTELVRRWENHTIMMRFLERYFSYLDRFHVPQNSLPSLHQVALTRFREIIVEESKAKVFDAVCAEIEKDRKNREVRKETLRKLVEILQLLSKDNEDLINELINRVTAESQRFYRNMAAEWASLSCADYLHSVDRLLHQEKERLCSILTERLQNRVNAILEKFNEELLENYKETLLKHDRGLQHMLEYKQSENLQLMYHLYARMKNMGDICAVFRDYIRGKGLALMAEKAAELAKIGEREKLREAAQDKAFVETLFGFWETYSRMVESAFEGNKQFDHAFRVALESFLNAPMKVMAAELLANYCDRILRSGREKLDEKEIEEKLEKVIRLFANLEDKDLFTEHYTQQLSRRLLTEKCESFDLEKAMISKLNSCCGPQFTVRLDGMLKDIAFAKEQNREFVQRTAEQLAKLLPHLNPEAVTVRVLTKANWTTPAVSAELPLPKDLVILKGIFEDDFVRHQAKRKVEWAHVWGTVVMDARFSGNRYELTMTTFQATLLHLFEARDEVPYGQIKEEMKLDEETLKKLLLSLSAAKHKVIERVDGEGKTFGSGDVFRFNRAFTSTARRITLPTPVIDEAQAKEKVDNDRDLAIEAAIVRVMKHRKQLEHPQLVQEVSVVLRQFHPDPRQIKKKVEQMIEKEFLERDRNEPRLLKYLA